MGIAYNVLLVGSAIFLSITILFCLLRAILGPRFTDRIIAVNIIGTKTIILIAVLAVLIDENYLVDICLVYAILSFLSVVVLTKAFVAQSLTKEKEKGADV